MKNTQFCVWHNGHINTSCSDDSKWKQLQTGEGGGRLEEIKGRRRSRKMQGDGEENMQGKNQPRKIKQVCQTM